MRTQHRRKVGFVLSGGASLGAIEAGMLHALFERCFPPTHSRVCSAFSGAARTQPIDFSRADWLIERSLADAREFLDGAGRDGGAPFAMQVERLRPHSHR